MFLTEEDVDEKYNRILESMIGTKVDSWKFFFQTNFRKLMCRIAIIPLWLAKWVGSDFMKDLYEEQIQRLKEMW